MFTGKTPSITPAQLTAFTAWIVSQALAFGWINGAEDQALLSGGATIVAVGWKIADAFLRGSRAKAHVPTNTP